jgi:hypothetical protein
VRFKSDATPLLVRYKSDDAGEFYRVGLGNTPNTGRISSLPAGLFFVQAPVTNEATPKLQGQEALRVRLVFEQSKVDVRCQIADVRYRGKFDFLIFDFLIFDGCQIADVRYGGKFDFLTCPP